MNKTCKISVRVTVTVPLKKMFTCNLSRLVSIFLSIKQYSFSLTESQLSEISQVSGLTGTCVESYV